VLKVGSIHHLVSIMDFYSFYDIFSDVTTNYFYSLISVTTTVGLPVQTNESFRLYYTAAR